MFLFLLVDINNIEQPYINVYSIFTVLCMENNLIFDKKISLKFNKKEILYVLVGFL